MAILAKLHASPDDIHHDFARGEFDQIKQQLELHSETETIWMLLKNAAHRKRFLIGMFIQ